MTAALFAARAGARVLLVETRPRPGAKIRVSGGGRCNVLPSQVSLEDFHTSGSRNTLRNILFSWPLDEVRAFFEQDLGVPLVVEPTGKVFPVSQRPLDVVEALLRECARAGVVLEGDARTVAIRRIDSASAGRDPHPGGGFEIETAGGRVHRGERLILATGGLSLPKTGSDGHGLSMARELGVELVSTYPALVPLTTSEPLWKGLAGVSMRARLRAVRQGKLLEETERELLFTHRGFSGPAVLDMSRHVTAGAAKVQLLVRWGGETAPDWERALRPSGKRRLATILGAHFPERFVGCALQLVGLPLDRRESETSREERQRLVEFLERYPLPVSGDEGYATAEVTGGGVALSELHPKSLESRRVPGLYFCGEILDAIGRIGGYNFLWAWVTGRTAGRAAARRSA